MQICEAGEAKMKETADLVFWPNKSKDIEKKAASCVTCFKCGKNLKTILPMSEVKRIKHPITQPGKTVQLAFVGPFLTNHGHKRFLLMAVDCASRWPNAVISKSCSTKAVIKLLGEIIARDGVPEEIKTDNESAFQSTALKSFVKSGE